MTSHAHIRDLVLQGQFAEASELLRKQVDAGSEPTSSAAVCLYVQLLWEQQKADTAVTAVQQIYGADVARWPADVCLV